MPDEVANGPRIGAQRQPHPSGDAAIGALADRQHGVVAYRQLQTIGFGRRAIQHRIAAGRLHRVHRGVYAVGRRTLTPKGHWMAAALAYGPNAVISHRTAAAMWGLLSSAAKIDITVSSGRRSRAMIRVHRAELHPEDIAQKDGIPVTSLARTLIDLAAILEPHQLLRAVEQSERLGRFDLRALDRALARVGRRGGSLALRAVLAEYRGPPPTRSELERRFLELLRRSRLPAPKVNSSVAGLEVDFFWPTSRLVVELDGRGYHTSPRAFELDRARDAALLRAGCRVLRVTYRRLESEPAKVLADVSALTKEAA